MQFRIDVAFDLDFTLCCGQVFRWQKRDGWWYGVVGEHAFKVRQVECLLEFENVPESFIHNYFGLNDDLQAISSTICKDEFISAALRRFEGLRIVRREPGTPPWQHSLVQRTQ